MPSSEFIQEFLSVPADNECEGLFSIDTLAKNNWSGLKVGDASVVVPSNDGETCNQDKFILVASRSIRKGRSLRFVVSAARTTSIRRSPIPNKRVDPLYGANQFQARITREDGPHTTLLWWISQYSLILVYGMSCTCRSENTDTTATMSGVVYNYIKSRDLYIYEYRGLDVTEQGGLGTRLIHLSSLTCKSRWYHVIKATAASRYKVTK